MNCTYALSYRSDSKRVYFEILGEIETSENAYVAVGFSHDMLMVSTNYNLFAIFTSLG